MPSVRYSAAASTRYTCLGMVRPLICPCMPSAFDLVALHTQSCPLTLLPAGCRRHSEC